MTHKHPLLAELLHLSEDERIQLAQDLWDSIPHSSDAIALTEEQIEEVERELAEHRADPSTAIPADVVLERLRRRLRS